MKTGEQIGVKIEKAYVDYIRTYGENPKRLLIGVIDLMTYKIYLDNIIGYKHGDFLKYMGCEFLEYMGCEIIECVTLDNPIFTN